MNKTDKVFGFLQNQAAVPLLFDEIAVMLGVHPRDRDHLQHILDTLAADGRVTLQRGRYAAKQAFDKEAAMLAIMQEHGISAAFPPTVETAADKLPTSVKKMDGRRDFRELLTVTIDGADARDFDDAISLETNENGWRLYVHIADVTHYVHAGDVIDREARARGTSCYFPDRVAPMLPTVLSNGICSLNPYVDRLVLTTVMDIDRSGNVLQSETIEAVIRSDYRLVYDDVSDILETGDCPKHYLPILSLLQESEKLCKVLQKRRTIGGSIDFFLPEAKIILDEVGNVKDIRPDNSRIANAIIEECMILCNRVVAEYAFYAELPFVYRIHEKPDDDKMQRLSDALAALGYSMPGTLSGKKAAELLAEVSGKPAEKAVNTLLLRAMMKARYSHECIGHFGLALRFYCHFTSPIRRYPDLMCHRILKTMLSGGDPYRFAKASHAVAVSSSEREEEAMKAERDADDMYMCMYMENHLGEIYEGTISSVTDFGFFVALPNMVEGLVRMADMEDDYYLYDEKTLTLTGKRAGRVFRLGDAVCVQVARVDCALQRIDFVLKDEERDHGKKVHRAKQKSKA